MSYLAWDDAYSVCVERLDEDHKHLFALLGTIHEACTAAMRAKSYPLIVNELIDYLSRHFAEEEAYMDRIGYPDRASHRLEHRRFLDQVLPYRQKIYENKQDYTGELLELTELIHTWLRHHILNMDQQYTNFVVLSHFK
ncbi:MAG TPA: bacteriohemerythrin [Desulfuromonadaceae bacterium]